MPYCCWLPLPLLLRTSHKLQLLRHQPMNQFPYSAPITFGINHGPSTSDASTNSELKNVNVLQVSVSGVPLIDFGSGGPLGNPFDNNLLLAPR